MANGLRSRNTFGGVPRDLLLNEDQRTATTQLGLKHKSTFQEQTTPRPESGLQVPRLLTDILSPTAGFLVSATNSDQARRNRRRLGKRALRTLQIGSV